MAEAAFRAPMTTFDFSIKPDTNTLGTGWIDGYNWDPSVYEPLGIRDGALVCRDATARDVTYGEDQQAIGEGTEEGELLGIGCAWRPTIYDAPTVTIEWAGYAPGDHWVEVAPLIHVVPGTPEHGFGIWCSALFGVGFLILGSISNPSSDFHDNVIAGYLFAHTAGTPRTIEMRSDGTHCTAYLDGDQVSWTNGYDLDPVPIPTPLLGSRLHGIAVDAHLTTPTTDVPSIPAAYSWAISETTSL